MPTKLKVEYLIEKQANCALESKTFYIFSPLIDNGYFKAMYIKHITHYMKWT